MTGGAGFIGSYYVRSTLSGRYLALADAEVVVLAAYAPLAGLVWITDAGLAWLWWAYGGFILARMVTLVLRERSDAWLVTGA